MNNSPFKLLRWILTILPAAVLASNQQPGPSGRPVSSHTISGKIISQDMVECSFDLKTNGITTTYFTDTGTVFFDSLKLGDIDTHESVRVTYRSVNNTRVAISVKRIAPRGKHSQAQVADRAAEDKKSTEHDSVGADFSISRERRDIDPGK